MADTKISALTELAVTPATDDEFAIVDTSAVETKRITYTTLQSGLDHDSLTNFVANEHINHSSVSITAGDGLTGGGDLTTTRTIDVDINGTTDLASPATNDELLISDTSATNAIRKADVASIVNLADHDALTNFVANEHIDHTSVTLTAGVGLTGGGTIAANRTFDLDINGLTADTIAAADELLFYDITGSDHNKITFANFESTLNHDSLTGFVSNEHIDHSSVSITGGTGISGGGTIAASRTLSLDINGLTADTIAAADTLAFYDDNGADHNKITFANFETALNHDSLTGFVANEHINHSSVSITAGDGLSGGGDLTTTRTINVDINGSTDLAAPAVGDEMLLGDISDSNNIKKSDVQTVLELTQGLSLTSTAQKAFGITTLSDGASISWDVSTNQVASVTLGGNRTLANPTNVIAGGMYVLHITQDGTGSRTLAFGTNYKFAGGVTPTITPTAGKTSVLLCFASSTSNLRCQLLRNFD